MPASEAAQRSARDGGAVKLWLSLVVLLAAAVGLAWIGAEPLRGETTASGLYFRTMEEGSGDPIGTMDGVMIEFEGRLPDGTVFQSTEGQGPVPLLVGQTIPGFSEALQKMKSGGRYRVRIPPSLGYGAEPPPGSPIPPNAELTFDIHVAQVVPNAALMTGGGAPQSGQDGAAGPEPRQP